MSEENFTVRSHLREYAVEFVTDVVEPLRPLFAQGAVVIADQRVLDLHGKRLGALIDPARVIAIEATEQNKDLDGCRRVIDELVSRGFRRNMPLIALGGGIIQDITAFSASILYRGVDWHFVPTTLLAQADSCIGSKTSINMGDKKNLLGNFYPPKRILIDTAFIDTLGEADVRSGIGEMLHFFYYADHPAIARLTAAYDALLHQRSGLRPFIRDSLLTKKAVAEIDEFDQGERNKFNYGHTFGHALETATRYAIPHGLAVTVGMDLANYLSVHLQLLSAASYNQMHQLLRRNMPDYPLHGIELAPYFAALSKDKKNVGTDVVAILSRGPGRLEKYRFPLDDRHRGLITDYFRHRIYAADVFPARAA